MKNTPRDHQLWNNAIRDRLTDLKHRQVNSSHHRALGRLTLSSNLLLQMIFLPVLFCGALIVFGSHLFQFWRDCILFWSSQLAIPVQAATSLGNPDQLGLDWSAVDNAASMPSNVTGIATFLICLAGFAVSLKMNGRLSPLKYLIRILCAVQLVALAYFLFMPDQFPYTISRHVAGIAEVGFAILVAIPVLLTLGYYVLDFSILTKLTHTILILAFFVVMIPQQIVLHVLILQNFSLMFMPILSICFGALFDVLIFVALYSWAASTIPAGRLEK